MGTSALVAIAENGLFRATYIHYDGYLDGVGDMLTSHYASDLEARRLCNTGYLSSLKEDLQESIGERVNSDKAELFSEADLFKNGSDFYYLWSDGQWSYQSGDALGEWKDVARSSELQRLESCDATAYPATRGQYVTYHRANYIFLSEDENSFTLLDQSKMCFRVCRKILTKGAKISEFNGRGFRTVTQEYTPLDTGIKRIYADLLTNEVTLKNVVEDAAKHADIEAKTELFNNSKPELSPEDLALSHMDGNTLVIHSPKKFIRLIHTGHKTVYFSDGKTLTYPHRIDNTFRVGDEAEFDSYNYKYTNPIKAISAKTIAIASHYSGKNVRMKITDFVHRNYDYNADEIAAKNLETSYTI